MQQAPNLGPMARRSASDMAAVQLAVRFAIGLLALVLSALVLVVAACGSDPVPDVVDTAEESASSSEAMMEDDGDATPVVVAGTPTAAPPLPTPGGPTPEFTAVPPEPVTESGDGVFPDVVAAVATQSDDGSWRFDVTLSSPYDSPERYADAWRVVGPDGTTYGERILGHDHANEQPFTRSQSGIEIPAEVEAVTIQGRDQVNGWGGQTFDLTLP